MTIAARGHDTRATQIYLGHKNIHLLYSYQIRFTKNIYK